MWCLDIQAKLQQQLQNAEATENLIKAELAAVKQQLQQALQEVQQVSAEAAAAAEAATLLHKAELQHLQKQLGSEGASQVG
jgi:2-phospho-L-lactate guanylyltransferase (CobY/MobA/RfbA family)